MCINNMRTSAGLAKRSPHLHTLQIHTLFVRSYKFVYTYFAMCCGFYRWHYNNLLNNNA